MCCYCTATMLGELNPVCLREHLLLMTFLACMCDLVKCSWKVQERRGSPSIIKEEETILGTVTFISISYTLLTILQPKLPRKQGFEDTMNGQQQQHPNTQQYRRRSAAAAAAGLARGDNPPVAGWPPSHFFSNSYNNHLPSQQQQQLHRGMMPAHNYIPSVSDLHRNITGALHNSEEELM